MSLIARLAAQLDPRLVVSLPPLAAIVLVAIYVTVESVVPGTLTAARPETIPEAIMVGNGPLALEMMAGGLNLNAPARVRSAPADYEVTPLEAALLARRIEVVRLLLRAGVDVSRSKRAPCLARELLPEALPLMGISASEPEPGGFATCFVPAGQ